MNRADALLKQVYDAMQIADEIDGIDDPRQYQWFMQQIEQTARQRFYNSVDNERDKQQKFLSIDEMKSNLVKYEADFLFDHTDYLYDMLRDGFKGFDNYSDEEIIKAHIDKFGGE
mgnify:FL=1